MKCSFVGGMAAIVKRFVDCEPAKCKNGGSRKKKTKKENLQINNVFRFVNLLLGRGENHRLKSLKTPHSTAHQYLDSRSFIDQWSFIFLSFSGSILSLFNCRDKTITSVLASADIIFTKPLINSDKFTCLIFRFFRFFFFFFQICFTHSKWDNPMPKALPLVFIRF